MVDENEVKGAAWEFGGRARAKTLRQRDRRRDGWHTGQAPRRLGGGCWRGIPGWLADA